VFYAWWIYFPQSGALAEGQKHRASQWVMSHRLTVTVTIMVTVTATVTVTVTVEVTEYFL
jgi:hypothetical protein